MSAGGQFCWTESDETFAAAAGAVLVEDGVKLFVRSRGHSFPSEIVMPHNEFRKFIASIELPPRVGMEVITIECTPNMKRGLLDMLRFAGGRVLP